MAVYAISDLHGCYDLYEQIKAFLQPEDKVYFLGDAGDRGPEGWKMIVTLLNDPQFIYLKGNHEEMLEWAMEDYRHSDGMDYYGATYNVNSNGGLNTFNDWLYGTREDYSYIRRLKELPVFDTYTNKDGFIIWLSHSGCPPVKNRFSGKYTIPAHAALWDRKHINELEWNCPDNMICVHGHTPIPYFFIGHEDVEITPGALWYCHDHKVCLDNGAFATGFTCLLDLDTFDEHIFYTNIEQKENN